jgi:iron complex transport system substrate-binding protein
VSFSAQISTYISLGYTATAEQAQSELRQVIDRPGWSDLRAVQSGRVHAIWHQFYNSPYHFVALQPIARWVYPAEFADLDPDAAFREFHGGLPGARTDCSAALAFVPPARKT